MTSPGARETRRTERRLPGLDRVQRRILRACLKYPFLVVAIAAAMMAYCLATLSGSPVDVFPDFAPPQIQIQTESLGLSTSDVESLVTVPLELLPKSTWRPNCKVPPPCPNARILARARDESCSPSFAFDRAPRLRA